MPKIARPFQLISEKGKATIEIKRGSNLPEDFYRACVKSGSHLHKWVKKKINLSKRNHSKKYLP